MCPKLSQTPAIDPKAKDLYTKARRRLASITPDNAEKIVGHCRYWSRPFLELFLQRCEHSRFKDPMAAWSMVRHGAELVMLIRIGDEPGELWSKAEQASWLVRALALEGEISGLAGFRTQMEAAFAKAVDAAKDRELQVLAGAELLRRQAVVCMRTGHHGEGRLKIGKSIELYRKLEPCPGLGEALLIYGLLGGPGSVVGLAEALCYVRPDRFEGMIFDAALWTLMKRLDEESTGRENQAMLGWLYCARQKWFRSRRKALRKMVVIWAEGRVLARLGLLRLTQARLSKAWSVFGDLVEPGLMTLCVLDLMSGLLELGEKGLAGEVLMESRQRLRRLGGDGELRDCLDRAGGLADLGEAGELLALRREMASAWLPDVERFYPLGHPGLAPDPDSSRDGKDFDGSSLTSGRDGQ